MSEKYIRAYRKIDLNHLKDHLLIFGDLSGSCSKCKELDIKIDAAECPQCKTEFNYISFRNIKSHLPKIQKLNESRPDIIMVDYDDYKKMIGILNAQEFLK